MKTELTLRDIQIAEFEILKDFVQVCDKNSLKYSLAYGTLLGAKRHKGFIPWDDDIDVWMPRADYEKFIKIYEEEKGHNNFKIANFKTFNPNLRIPFSKILDMKIATNCSNGNPAGKEGHLWIDVFPTDVFPPTRKCKRKLIIGIEKIFISWIAMGNTNWSDKNGLWNSINKFFVKLYRKIGINRIASWSEKLAINCNSQQSLNSFSEQGCIVWSEGKNDCFKYNAYDDFQEIEFEGNMFKVISDYEIFLSSFYGKDYMELPSEDKRITHEFKAYLV